MKAITALLVLAALTTPAAADEADQLVGNLEDRRTQVDVTKYEFNAAHKIVGETTKQYCGEGVYQ